MPNHFHLALYPKTDGELQKFMGWLTKTHTQRWHVSHKTTGHGPLYQGRYKSFIVDTDEYYLTLMKYIEQNPLRANLVERSEDWEWGSLYRRESGTPEQKRLLYTWLLKEPENYLENVNTLLPKGDVEEIRVSVKKGCPYGGEVWRLNLEYTNRGVGRPVNGA